MICLWAGASFAAGACLRRSTGTLHSTIFTKIYNFTNSCCMSFWWGEHVGFPPKRCFKNRGSKPHLFSWPQKSIPTTWPVGNRILTLEFQILPKSINGGLAARKTDLQGLKSWWFLDSSRSNKSISRTCTSQDRSRTAQHGYVPLLVHQSLPIISSCKACMSLYAFGPRNQTRIWLSSTRPSKLWKDGSIPLGPAGIKIRCEKEGIPGCFSHALRKSQVAIALGWGPWRAMWWMVKLVTLWFNSYPGSMENHRS